MRWVDDDMPATELEMLRLTSADVHADVEMAAAQPSEVSKVDTPAPMFNGDKEIYRRSR
jgi:hypothetical protein